MSTFRGPHFAAIEVLIQRSTLAENEKRMLLNACLNTSDEDLVFLAKLFKDDPTWMTRFSENIQSKQAAFSSDDPTQWQQILHEEIAALEKADASKLS